METNNSTEDASGNGEVLRVKSLVKNPDGTYSLKVITQKAMVHMIISRTGAAINIYAEGPVKINRTRGKRLAERAEEEDPK